MEIHSGSADQIRRSVQRVAIENRYQTERTLNRIVKPDVEADQFSISKSGLERSRLHASLMDKLAALPETRDDRIAEVKARIAEGFYRREAIVSEMADKMMNETALTNEKTSGAELPSANYRNDLMHEVGEKMKDGFYSDNDVMNFVADRLLQIYGIDQADDLA